ncbi:MAG: DUF1501 domain-containing protein [Planctomycetaceae bacterium]
MLHRRDAMIRLGQAGLGGLTLPTLLRAENSVAKSPQPRGTARSCILLYLWGGPPQQDMWDMKPHAPAGIRSEFEPIDTVVPGIQISDQLPLMARHTDKMAIIRSYTHPSNQHEVGVYHTLTGKINNTLAVPRNQRNRNDFPHPGAVVSYFSPPSTLPASVTIPRPIGHDGVIYTGTYAGFLGPQHDPMELAAPGEVKGPPPHSLTLADGLNDHRVQSRYGLLKTLELHDRSMQAKSATQSFDRFREQAFRVLTAPEAKGAFDLGHESDAMRERYGRNEYGESFLLSRRLIESGVRLVTVVWYYICPDGNVANVWDNHGGTGSLGGLTGYQMLKQPYCLPSLDRAYAALLGDLSERGLLDETLVVMLGEFGRTPKINAANGRDHWGPCQSVVLAGGGVKGGQVYGASDKIAAFPARDPVAPEDVIATMYEAMGIPPSSLIHDAQNRPYHISEGTPVAALF